LSVLKGQSERALRELIERGRANWRAAWLRRRGARDWRITWNRSRARCYAQVHDFAGSGEHSSAGSAAGRRAVKVFPLKTAPSVPIGPKLIIPALPVVDAGAIAEIIVNGGLLGALNGTAAAQLADAIRQGLPVGGWVWGRIGADLPTLGGVAQQGTALAWSLPGLEGLYGAVSRLEGYRKELVRSV
jgi:hypothetical protein